MKTAIKIHEKDRTATADEKEILTRYSGFGGIKDVLNIGMEKSIPGRTGCADEQGSIEKPHRRRRWRKRKQMKQ